MAVIRMTKMQQAVVSRKEENCYVTIAMVTDYDCWHDEHAAVTVDQIISNLTKNAENACKLVRHVVATMPEARTCNCGSALKHAIITDRAVIPETIKERLGLLIAKYTGE